MNISINILVTGAGAVLGQGILRSLNMIKDRNIIIHSADPDYRSTGHCIAQKTHKLPFASDPSYIEEVKKIIECHDIRILMIGTDTELPLFAKNKELLESTTGVKIVVSNTEVIDIANDKWKTAAFLKTHGFPYPQSVMASDRGALEVFKKNNRFPYLAKPVDGARSKGIVIIQSDKELAEVIADPKNLVIQEYLPDTDGEFTSGCIVVDGKCKAVVTLRRDLRDGNTYRAYYRHEYTAYDAFIADVAEKLGVDGPCNFQFRIRNQHPVIFEINSRFSGTTPLRFMFGYNEVEAILLYLTENQPIGWPVLKEGMVMRAWSDMFIPEEEVQRLKNNVSVSLPHAFFYEFNKGHK
jgi:carbamoyl-phosphate synthase large subunit